jgi:hypothetical protein
MKQMSLRICEKNLLSVRRKLRHSTEITEGERKILETEYMALDYFDIHDATEGTNMREMFYALYLEPQNIGRTLTAIASDVGFDVRSLSRYRKLLINVYERISEKLSNF